MSNITDGWWWVQDKHGRDPIIIQVWVGRVFRFGIEHPIAIWRAKEEYTFLAPVPKLPPFQPEGKDLKNIIMDTRKAH